VARALLALTTLRHSRRRREAPPPGGAVVIFMLSFVLLALLVGAPPIHEDTARDLLLARDCVDAGRCAMAGPHASFAGLTQGALWGHLLEVCRTLGLALRGSRYVVLALHAASAALVYGIPRRMCGWPAGLAAWGLYLAMSSYTSELPILFNSGALPLPLALFYVCLSSLAIDGEVLASAGAGVALGLAVDTHVVAAVLVPFFFGVVVAVARRPLVATAAAIFAVVVPLLVSSPRAVVADATLLASAWAPSAGVLALSLVVGLSLRRRAKTARPVTRSRAVLAAACIFSTALFAGARIVTGHGLEPRYFAVLAAPAAIFVGAWLVQGFRGEPGLEIRIRRTNAVVALAGLTLLGFLMARSARSRRSWNAFDAEVLARDLYARGWSYPDLFRHLRGPDAGLLVAALAPYGPPPPASRENPKGPTDLLVAKVQRSLLPASVPTEWDVVDLGGSAAAVMRPLVSWIDLSALTLCQTESGAPLPCQHVDLDVLDPDEGARGTVAQRAYPTLLPTPSEPDTRAGAPLGPLRCSIEVRVHASSPARVLTLVDTTMPWRIERALGVRYAGTLPGREVTLEGEGDGTIVFLVDVPAGSVGRFRRWLPSFVETSQAEISLRKLFVTEGQR
jgi:hypothetical protein